MDDEINYIFMVERRGRPIGSDTPCLCMNCPECRGYVMDTRVEPEPCRTLKPKRHVLAAQAEAMLIEANEGPPAVLERDVEVNPVAIRQWRHPQERKSKDPRAAKPRRKVDPAIRKAERKAEIKAKAMTKLEERILRMDAELNQLKGNTG